MSSEILMPVNEMLSGERELRDWAEENNQRVGANADEMYVGQANGERYFVKSDLPEAEKAAHIAAAPLMEDFEHSPEILYDPETEEVAISELGDNARAPNSAKLSDQVYDRFAPVDEDAFYEVAAQRWVLGDSNVYDNVLVEAIRPEHLIPGNEREVFLHDFDHAGKHSSKGRIRGFREAFEYVGEKLGTGFSYRRFKKEIEETTSDLDVEAYRETLQEMGDEMRDSLHERVLEHGENISGNIERGRG